MFYNLHRSTKLGREEAEKKKLSGAGKNVINPHPKERLLNFQKRKKLKELLINKFSDKFGLKDRDQVLENEITNFIQSEKLNDRDLQRLDAKLKLIFDSRKKKEQLKTTLASSLQDKNNINNTNTINLNKSQPNLLPEINNTQNPT